MDLNKKILQNRKLAPKMKFFSSEIDRLTKLYEAIRTPGREYNYPLARQIKNSLTETKEQFKDINDMYEEEAIRGKRPYRTNLYINMIERSCKEIDQTFLRLDLNEHR